MSKPTLVDDVSYYVSFFILLFFKMNSHFAELCKFFIEDLRYFSARIKTPETSHCEAFPNTCTQTHLYMGTHELAASPPTRPNLMKG